MSRILYSLGMLFFFTCSFAQNGTTNGASPNMGTTPEITAPPPATPTATTSSTTGAGPATGTGTTSTVPTAPSDVTNSNPTLTTPVVTTPTTPSQVSPGITTTSTVTTLTPATLFTCGGTGPVWNLDMSKSGITFSSPTDKSMIIKGVTPLSPTGTMAGSLLVYTTTTADNRPVTVLIRKNDLGCPMDPSGTSRLDTVVIFPDRVLAGCCNVKPGI